jgi:hypothetical protein
MVPVHSIKKTDKMDNALTDRRRDRLEVYNTVILAIATLAVAWCSYQSHLWSGIQTFGLAESNKYGRLAQQHMIQAGQRVAMDEAIIITFIEAVISKNQQRIDFILSGTEELSGIMSNWYQSYKLKDTTAALHPMVTTAYKELTTRRMQESEKLSQKGTDLYEEAAKANRIADNYDLFTVMFSMVMFLGAIATKAVRPQIHHVLVMFSALICISALILLFFNMPIAHKT